MSGKRSRLAVLAAPLMAVYLGGCGVNPVTGKQELQFIPESSELQIGQQNYAPSRQQEGGDFTLDPELTRYVREVGNRLAAVSDRKLPYEFVVLENSVPNAWALPGGKIAVNRGLLTQLHDEAELAAVLGHEIVHAAARHGAKAQERGTLLQAGMMAATIGAAVSETNGALANLALQGAGIGAQMVQMKYGRDQELEADHYGMVYMQRAGYDPHAAVTLQQTFVRLFNSKEKSQSWMEGLFASHPPSEERVARNEATLRELGSPKGKLDADRFAARMAKLRRMQPAYDRYDQAMAAAGRKDFASARKLADEAVRMLPKNARFVQLQGDLAMVEKQPGKALGYYQRAIALDGNYYGPFLGGGVAQFRLGNKAKAQEWLTRSNDLLPTAPAVYYLGSIAKDRGDLAGARRYFQAVAGSQGEYGRMATAELQRMDQVQGTAQPPR